MQQYYNNITEILQKIQLDYILLKAIDFLSKKDKIKVSVIIKSEGDKMPSYLGLYIGNNVIKYAKVSKEKDKTKIDSFGIKFYTNISQTIKQIVEETYSYKTPISVNLTGETYQYFNMFSLLNKKDLEKAIKLEFESFCSDKGYNPNSLETRYAIVNNIEDKEKLKVINISDNKIELNKVQQNLDGYRLGTIVPISMSIPNLITFQPKENTLIVNIEDSTTVTTVLDGNIYAIDTIDEGSREILEKINLKENSYSKAYEICQNTTIYTAEVQEFTEDQSRYLEDIMPTLYNIVGKVQKLINESIEPINKVYITGTLSCVNNIDLYFQEYLGKVKCEILKPYFVQNMVKEVNIKDYVEVNSAISLALQGLGEGIQGINFKKGSLKEGFLGISIGGKDNEKPNKKSNSKFNMNDFGDKLSRGEMSLVRSVISLMIFVIIFSVFSVLLMKQIQEKENEVDSVTTKIKAQISKVQKDTSTLNTKEQEYETLIKDLQDVNEKISSINASKNLIPNLLNQIMNEIDESVQITSIQNTKDKHIVIVAQSPKYQGLGYFKTRLKTKNILNDVVSGSSMKQNGVVVVTIEGDLP